MKTPGKRDINLEKARLQARDRMLGHQDGSGGGQIRGADSAELRKESTFSDVHGLFSLAVPELGCDYSYQEAELAHFDGIWARSDRGDYTYRLRHAPKGASYTLIEVYANCATGGMVGHILKTTELQLWVSRMLADLQIIDLPDTSRKPPDDAWPVGTQRVYDGFVMLVRCHLRHDSRPVSGFTIDFGSAWCGVSEKEFGTQRTALQEARYIEKTGQSLNPETLFKSDLYRLVP